MKKKFKVSVIGTSPPCIGCNRTYARGGDKRRIEVLRGCALEGWVEGCFERSNQ